MKLYEMLHFMGDEYMDIFTAIRTITQRPVNYFLKKKDRIWELLEDDHPEEKGKLWKPVKAARPPDLYFHFLVNSGPRRIGTRQY